MIYTLYHDSGTIINVTLDYSLHALLHFSGAKAQDVQLRNGMVSGLVNMSRRTEATHRAGLPHERLVNIPTYRDTSIDNGINEGLKIDETAVEAFVERYGPLHPPSNRRFKQQEKLVSFTESVAAVRNAQTTARDFWVTGSHEKRKELEKELQGGLVIAPIQIRPGEGRGRDIEVVLETDDLWRYVCFLLLFDRLRGRASLCQREACPHPYFVAERRGQLYCSRECAVYASVQRFRDRAHEETDRRSSGRKRK